LINTMTFGNLQRMITGEHNLFKEMKLYNKFDYDNSGKLDLFDFKYGFRLLEEEMGVDNLYSVGLRKVISDHGETALL